MNVADHDLLYMQLPLGRDKAETIGELAQRLTWIRRRVERAIRDCRMLGRPVCTESNGEDKGVWVATSSSEMLDQYRRLRSRYVHQALTARSVLATARRMERAEQRVEQTTLFGEAA